MRKQQLYYSVFARFSDYCMLSIFAYAIFAAISLIWMSISEISRLIYAVAMPMQIFNMKYFEEMKYEEISSILGTSIGALKASYHLAVQKVKSFFDDDI